MTYRVFTAPTPRSTLGAMLLWLGCIAALLSSSLTFGATPAALAKTGDGPGYGGHRQSPRHPRGGVGAAARRLGGRRRGGDRGDAKLG